MRSKSKCATIPIVITSILSSINPLFSQNLGKLTASVSGASAVNNMRWSIAGDINGEEPNILSELDYRNNISIGTSLGLHYEIQKYLKLYASYTFLNTLSGEVTDTDYASDNRSEPTYFAKFNNKGGTINTFYVNILSSIYIDKKYIFNIGTHSFIYNQRFRMLSPKDPLLNSSYVYRTRGLGFNISRQIGYYNMIFEPYILLSSIRYSSYGTWNLIEDLEQPKSFVHKARGENISYGLKTNKRIGESLEICLNFFHIKERTHHGLDKVFFKNRTQYVTRLNGAVMRTNVLEVGLVKNF